MRNKVLVEVCTGSFNDSLVAFKAGADRLEINSAIELGGLSPSPGVLATALECISIPIIAMVRPHPGGFIYSEKEKEAILFDTELFLSHGAAGIAVGALNAEGRVDIEFISRLRKLSYGRELVFHRAFDLLFNLHEGASILADLGVDRILTSGGYSTALEGKDVIRNLSREFKGVIEFLPGSGLNSSNASAFVEYTRCSQIHGSFSRKFESEQSAASVLPEERISTSDSEIRMTVQALNYSH